MRSPHVCYLGLRNEDILSAMGKELPETTNFVAEIPIYVETKNPKGVEAVIRRLVRLLNIDIDLTDLDRTSSELEKNMSQAVAKYPELTKQIKKLEENYDKELFDQKGDFERWLKQQGIYKL